MVWDAEVATSDLKPLRHQLNVLEPGHESVGSVFLCRGKDDRPKVGVSSFHPSLFGSLGSVHWQEAVDFTIAAFEGERFMARSNAGFPIQLNVDGMHISARLIATLHGQLVISSVPEIPVAVVYANGEVQPRLAAANWRLWHDASCA